MPRLLDGEAPFVSENAVHVPPDARKSSELAGLPPTYRMRADPHYVEALVAWSAPSPAASAAPVVTTVLDAAPEVPSGGGGAALNPMLVRPPVDDAPPPQPPPAALGAAAAALADAFDAIQAALRDLPTSGRPLRDRVAIELARAEATRGRWLADAAAVMQTEPMPALDEVDLVAVLRQVVTALGPEDRLSGAAARPAPEGICKVFGDERLLATAIGASLAALRAVVEDRGDGRKMSVILPARRDGAMRTIEISQWAVRLPLAAYEPFFDVEWRDHPAGPSGALQLAAARRIAVAHGGSLEIVPINGGGCCLLLSVPGAG